jgi:hypothetical protein
MPREVAVVVSDDTEVLWYCEQLHRTLSTRDLTTLGSVPVWDVAGSLNTPPSYPRQRRRLLSLSTFRLKTCFAVCSQEMLDVSALS